jgi:hypothetical protein
MKSGSVSEFDAVSKTTDGAVCGFLKSKASLPASTIFFRSLFGEIFP